MTDATGLVFDIKRFAIHDGPGIRTTVFLKGCPLVCACCHNPESQDPAPEIVVRAGRCVGCGECLDACPVGAASLAPSGPAKDSARCLRCGSCADACPTGARERAGRAMTAAEVVAEVVRDRLFYAESGGGATVSGGEPLLQPRFLAALLRGCREAGIHTALDTCGHAPWEDLARVLPWTDLVLFDLKHPDDRAHAAFTGVSNATILDNLRRLSAAGQAVIVRVPVVPGFNDDEPTARALASVVAGLSDPPAVELLPYHRLGIDKYARLGRVAPLPDTPRPQRERVFTVASALRERGLTVSTGEWR